MKGGIPYICEISLLDQCDSKTSDEQQTKLAAKYILQKIEIIHE
jgi:hypothetical protein